MEDKNLKLVDIGCGPIHHPEWINLDLRASDDVKKYNIKKKLPFEDSSVDAIYHSHLLEHLTKDEAYNFLSECHRVLKPGAVMRVVVPDLEQICQEYLVNLEKGFSNNDNLAVKDYYWNKLELFDQMIRKKSGGEMLEAIQSHRNMINEDYIIKRNGDDFKKFFSTDQPVAHKSFVRRKISQAASFIAKVFFSRSGELHKWMYDKLDLKILLTGIGFRGYQVVDYNTSAIIDWEKYNLDKSEFGNYSRKPDSLFVEVIK